MIFKVLITERALKDMDDIYYYIANNTGSTKLAMSQYDAIADAINLLEEFPYRFAIFYSIFSENIRILCVGNYEVFYLIRDYKVIILAVLYGTSNIKAELKRRLS